MKTADAAKLKKARPAIIDEIQLGQDQVSISKEGDPSAAAGSVPIAEDPLAIYKFGCGRIVGDILSPVNEESDWEYDCAPLLEV